MATTVARHAGQFGSWEMISRDPHPALRPHVRRYCGYAEDTLEPLARVEAATPDIPLIVSFGPEIDIDGSTHTSFVAGLHDGFTKTAHDGHQRGIQIDLSPVAAGMVLGVPMHELAHRVVALDDVLAPGLADRLRDAPSWDARFDLLDALLARRIEAAPPPPPSLEWAWRRLTASRGRIAVGALAAEVGCSPRYLTLQFRDHLGMPPKALARILRFQHALDRLQSDDGCTLRRDRGDLRLLRPGAPEPRLQGVRGCAADGLPLAPSAGRRRCGRRAAVRIRTRRTRCRGVACAA